MAGKISLYMTNFKNQTYEMPIAPSEITVKTDSGNETIEVIELGEINRLSAAAKLEKIDLELTIPIDLSKRKRYWTAKKISWPQEDGGERYMRVLSAMFNKHEVVRVLVTGTRLNNKYTFDSFEWRMSDTGDEYHVQIGMTEWRDYSPLVLKKAPIPKKVIRKKPRPAKKIGVGSTVIVNGQLHVDSYGRGPGVVEKNARRKINFVAPGRRCPYHVTNMQGGWRGWVTKGSVRGV